MYICSNRFKEEIKKLGRMKVTKFFYDNKEIVPERVSFKQMCTLFTTSMREIEFEIKNCENLIDKIVNLKSGIKIDDNFEYIDYGSYKVNSCEDVIEKKSIKCIAYDKMSNFMAKYSDILIEETDTTLTVLKKICFKCGVELYTESFYNSDLLWETDYYNLLDVTFRDVLDQICQATMTTAFIKEEKLYFSSFNETQETLDKTVLKKAKLDSKFGPINTLTLGRGSVEDNIYAEDIESIELYGRTEIRFDENEIVDKRRYDVINGMFNKIKGLEYYPFNIEDIGLIYFQPCDLININDLEENTKKSIILNITFNLTSGIKQSLSADVPTTYVTNFKAASKEEKRVLKVERLANKQEGIISDVVQTQTEQSEKLTEVIQDNTSIKNTVSETNVKLDNTNDNLLETEKKLSTLEQTTEELSLKFSRSGGSNLLINSCGFGGTTNWNITGDGIIATNQSIELVQNGSGSAFILSNKTIKQEINVRSGVIYSLGVIIKKGLLGTGYIKIYDTTSSKMINIEDERSYIYEKLEMQFETTSNKLTVELHSDVEILFTSSMLNVGPACIEWMSAQGEIYNSSMGFNELGLTIKSAVYDGRLELSPLEIANYYNDNGSVKKTFYLNKDVLGGEKIQANSQIGMIPFKVLSIVKNSKRGWAWVKESD